MSNSNTDNQLAANIFIDWIESDDQTKVDSARLYFTLKTRGTDYGYMVDWLTSADTLKRESSRLYFEGLKPWR